MEKVVMGGPERVDNGGSAEVGLWGYIHTEPPGWDARGRQGTQGLDARLVEMLVPWLISDAGDDEQKGPILGVWVGVGWMNKRVAYGSQR